jgi:hypothetical protein
MNCDILRKKSLSLIEFFVRIIIFNQVNQARCDQRLRNQNKNYIIHQQMKKKNGLLQTFFYDFLKIQVTNWVREILVTFENQSSMIY